MAETWVINEHAYFGHTSIAESINFTSNNTRFSFLYGGAGSDIPSTFQYNSITVAIIRGNDEGSIYRGAIEYWIDQAYRVVTFDEPLDPSTPIGQWFSANAEKQQSNITLDLSTIGLPAGSHSIQIKLSDDGVTKADSELSNSVTYVEPEPLPQLDTPTNLTADGTNIEFDEVENAEEYEIFADGVSIGEYEPAPSGYTVGVRSITGGGTTTFYVSFDNGLTWETVSASSVWNDKTTIKLKADGNMKLGVPDRAFYYINSGTSESELASGFMGFLETENFAISSLTTINNELILGFEKGIDD